jgi:Flp pilus assembly protein TadD
MSALLPDRIEGRLPRAWMLLASGALGLSTLLALLLVGLRTPWLGAALPGQGWFGHGLVLHVTLAITVWFLSSACLLWTLRRASVWSWIALELALAGVAGMLVAAAWRPASPVLSNYVPVLSSSVFLAGLAWFAGGVLMTLLLAAPGLRDRNERALLTPGLPIVMALVSLVWTAMRLPAGLPPQLEYETLFWGAGHVLQLSYVAIMMIAWIELARLDGIVIGTRVRDAALLLQTVPAVAILLIHSAFLPDTPDFRAACTTLMRVAAWPGATLLAGAFLLAARGRPTVNVAARAGWMWSITLFGSGIVLGTLIRNDTVLVPAHYHATVGAVTTALMALAMQLAPRFGWTAIEARFASWQTRAYACGLLTLALALAWSGWHGVPRKIAVATHPLEQLPQIAGMAACAVGGVLAVGGGLAFVMLLGRSVTARRRRVRAPRGDRRLGVAGMAVALIVLGGIALSMLPSHPPAPSVNAAEDPVRKDFDEAVRALQERRAQAAVAALDRVLAAAPSMPEAHVNMGFALLQLARASEARTFFERATDLQPQQANAYYGLAVALESTGDLPGAIGAMRTYVHLAEATDPHVRKARAALWEWEAQRTAQPQRVSAVGAKR